jgi:hypothetical protein
MNKPKFQLCWSGAFHPPVKTGGLPGALYNIQGYNDIKDIVRRALDAENNYNLLFIAPHITNSLIPVVTEVAAESR